jgi:hypothetical protein
MLNIPIISPKNFRINKKIIVKKNESLNIESIIIDPYLGSLCFEVLNKKGLYHSFKYENVWEALQTGWDVLPILNKELTLEDEEIYD